MAGGSLGSQKYGEHRSGYIGKDDGKKVRIVVVKNHAFVKEDKLKRCLGNVGVDKMCGSSNMRGKNFCGTFKAHEKLKWLWPEEFKDCEEVYAVPATQQRSAGGPCTFKEPIIPVNWVLPEFVKEFESGFNSSAEWVEVIMAARMAHDEEQLRLSQLRDKFARYSPSGKDIDEEDSFGSMGSVEVHIPRTADLDKWEGTSIMSLPDGFDSEFMPPPAGAYEDVILEHQEAIKRNSKTIKKLTIRVPAAIDETATSLEPSVKELIDNLNAAATSLGKLSDSVGDVDVLRSKYQVSDLSSGVIAALDFTEALGDIEGLTSEVDNLKKLVTELGDETNARVLGITKKLLGHFNPKLQAILERLGKVEISLPSNPPPPPPIQQQPLQSTGTGNLYLSSVIMNDDGTPSGFTLGSLVATLKEHELAIDKLRSDVSAQGGVTVGSFSYASEKALKTLVMKEMPAIGTAGRASMSAFVDATGIFTYDVETAGKGLGSNWSETSKSMRAAGLVREIDRLMVGSCSRRNIPVYHKGDEAPKAGKKITAFNSFLEWDGDDGNDGIAGQISSTLDDCLVDVNQHIEDYLPAGTELFRLASHMATKSRSFHQNFHDHIRKEMVKLKQLGVPEEECMVLASEEYCLIFNRFFDARKKILQHEEGMDVVDFSTRMIWVSMKTHMIMEELMKDGIKYHPIISAAFIRFLTKQTGANVATNMGPRILAVEGLVKKEVKALKDLFTKNEKNWDRMDTWKSALLNKNSTLKKP